MTLPIHSTARNAFPGDTVRLMRGSHVDTDGNPWPNGTEYTPISSGVDNTLPGSPTVQEVRIAGTKRRFFEKRSGT